MSNRLGDCGGPPLSTALVENGVDGDCDDNRREAPLSDPVARDRSALPPAFTPHEEEKEWASVTPAEMLEIESDLRGLSVDGSAPSSKSSSPRMNYDIDVGSGGGRGGDSFSLLAGPLGGESGPQPFMTEEERETAMLPALEAEIAAIPASDKDAYLEATRQCPDLVDDEHKKAFLFKEGFDAKLAARRLARHWQYKRQLFGPERCYLPMTLCGTMSNDTIALSSGFLHLLTAKDAFGRAIIFGDPSKHHATMYSRESMIRAFWYLLHVATEDPVVRRRGVVFIIFPRNGTWNQFDSPLFRSMFALGFKYMCPVGRSIHLCHPDSMFHIINPILKLLFGNRLRKRFKVHYGTDEAVLRSLAGFGLARDILPSELGGLVHLNQVQWLSNRMLLEGLSGQFLPVPATSASKNDIGRPVQAVTPTSIAQRRSSGLPESIIKPNLDLDAELDNLDTIISMAGYPGGAKKPQSISTSYAQPLTTPCNGLFSSQQPTKEVEGAMAAKRSQERGSRRNDPFSETSLGGGPKSTCTHVAISNNQTGISSLKTMKMSMHDAKVSFSQALDQCSAESFTSTQAAPLQSKLWVGSSVTAPPRRKAKPRGVAAKGGDPRMTRAIKAKLADPHMSLFDALIVGGFKFPTKEKGVSDRSIVDCEGVSLFQRKNQLNRRLRERRREDPRMARAVAAIRTNPTLSLREALVEGGYKYRPLGVGNIACDRTLKDAENVTLHSRKNELKKRLIDLGLLDPAASENMQTGALSGFQECNGLKRGPQLKRDQHRANDRVGSVSGCDDCASKHVSLPHTSFEETQNHPAGVNVEKCLHIKRNDSFDESIRELPGLEDLGGDHATLIVNDGELLLGSWLWGGMGDGFSPC